MLVFLYYQVIFVYILNEFDDLLFLNEKYVLNYIFLKNIQKLYDICLNIVFKSKTHEVIILYLFFHLIVLMLIKIFVILYCVIYRYGSCMNDVCG
jgi:hypothetical protein